MVRGFRCWNEIVLLPAGQVFAFGGSGGPPRAGTPKAIFLLQSFLHLV